MGMTTGKAIHAAVAAASATMAFATFGEVIYENDFATPPTLATATPAAPVATFSALPFRRTKAALGGISCVSASGYRTAQSLYDLSLEPMIDNLRVSLSDVGFVITVR